MGLSRTGLSAARFLSRPPCQMYIWDDHKKAHDLPQDLQSFFKNYTQWPWENLDFLVLSPGIPFTHPEPHKIVAYARDRSVKIISDLDLLAWAYPQAKFIGITGTNGKTTTTQLTYEVLRAAGHNVYCAGNIGIPAMSFNVDTQTPPTFVLELSSYQLDLIQDLKLDYAILLNIQPDHLTRHGSFDGYINVKKKILSQLKPSGRAFVSLDSEASSQIYQESKSPYVESFSGSGAHAQFPQGVFLSGVQNLENVAGVHALTHAIGVPQKSFLQTYSLFKGLPHRQETIGVYKHITFINDSKATNKDATGKALGNYHNIYWLVGGKTKDGDVKALTHFQDRVKKVYIFGADRDPLYHQLKGTYPCIVQENLKDIMAILKKDVLQDAAKATVLLSPACESFDQYQNFEDRGDMFKKHIQETFP